MDRYQQLLQRDLRNARTTAQSDDLEKARRELVDSLPERGLGDEGDSFISFFSMALQADFCAFCHFSYGEATLGVS